MIYNTFIVNPIRPDFIEKCLDTMYRYTNHDFRVIVVDQTMDGVYDKIKDGVHLYLRPHRNLGFSKSMNEGIIHSIRWGSKFTTVMNDDIEFMDSRWWDGILETFDSDEKIMAVNPMSPREPGWGYGLDHGNYIDLLDYKTEFSEEDYNYLLKGDFSAVEGLPDSFPRQKRGVIDAIATWCTIFKTETLVQHGLFEERYYPGGGEDYDYNARIYRENLRMVGTTRSWVWHWWGSSKDKTAEHKGLSLPVVQDLVWMNPDALWPPDKNLTWKDGKYQPTSFDPWGKVTLEDGSKEPMYRVPEVGVIDI